MRILKILCSHLTVVLCMVFAVFLVLDQFNPMMNFVDNTISRALLGLLCLSGVTLGICTWTEKRRGRARFHDQPR